MTGYVRKDTSNNIADGNIINAADLDAEFDGVVDAFNASTGHKHDGTAGEGAPITVVGPTQDVTVSATAVTPKTTNTVDLGSSSLKFKDIFIVGTATLPTVSATTGNITTVNATTVDTTNVEVTNIKAKDGTSAATIADTTGVMTIASAILTTADINGGTIDGTAIGGTTPAAGAFTTLSASAGITGDLTGNVTGNVSGNAGSVNNGVYTIGDQTIAGIKTFSSNPVLSAGTANGVAYLNGSKVLTTGSALTFDGTNFYTTGKAFIGGTADGGEKVQIESIAGAQLALRYAAGTTWSLQTNSGGGLQWNYNGSEQMRLTSTGLGIGTSLPGYKLDVSASVADAIGRFLNSDTSNGNGVYIKAGGINSGKYALYVENGSGSQLLNLNASGNLGLGVTPSAWQTGRVALQIQRASAGGGVSIHTAATSQAIFAANTYFNGTNDIYTSSGAASSYVQFNGGHSWYTAPSGTAGNAISFTQAMTLDASGNLGIATSSISSLGSSIPTLQIKGGIATRTGGIRLTSSDASYDGYFYADINGFHFGSATSTPVTFDTGGSERARIDSSGNLLVGTTSTIGSGVVQGQGSNVFNAKITVNTGGGYIAQYSLSTGTANFGDWYYNGTRVGYISSTGTTTTYATSSDYRLKENIQPMTGALAKVAALKPCTYNWKADGSDGEGFIAHELAEVCPQAVTGEKDAVDADGNPVYQGIDTSFLVATLTAAIQEQQAIIESLKADVAALKGAA